MVQESTVRLEAAKRHRVKKELSTRKLVGLLQYDSKTVKIPHVLINTLPGKTPSGVIHFDPPYGLYCVTNTQSLVKTIDITFLYAGRSECIPCTAGYTCPDEGMEDKGDLCPKGRFVQGFKPSLQSL